MDDAGDLTPAHLLQAYRIGVFPMSESRDSTDVFWVNPELRGIIPIDGFHVSRSLRKTLLKGAYSVTHDQDFKGVVAQCADRPDTWINDTIFDLYAALHVQGHAHSVEVWHKNQLVGGVYGVSVGAAFFGESMFSTATDASKIALTYLLDRLKFGGYQLFDTQFITAHLASLGGIEIPRTDYKTMLRKAVYSPADFYALAENPAAQDVVQRMAQTS